MKYTLTIALLIMALAGCKTKKTATADTTKETAPIPARPATYRATAHAVVYKTKADYSSYVPVTLTDDGSAIASYPAPTDVFYRGVIATPTPLADGYLLDNRGVTPHSAFIKMTYDQYSKLTETPKLADLYKMVVDKAPFTEMYDLGERNGYPDAIGSINTIIKSGRLKEYKKLL